jgi:hypothetical protein
MLSLIEPANMDFSLDFQALDGSESWIVENVSEGGFGAIIPPVRGDWIKVGSLVAVQSETAKYWGAGVVRRLTHDEFQQRRVGIQLLSKAVIPVKLSPAATVSSFNAIGHGDAAVLLSTAPDKHGDIALVLKSASFTPDQPLEMRVRGKPYYLTPRKLVESADDFDWAKFKVAEVA